MLWCAVCPGTRGVTTGEVVGQAFGDVRMLIPIAPPDGLYLQKAMFTMYNDRLPADRQKLDYELDPQAKARVADFEKEQIVKHILGKVRQRKSRATLGISRQEAFVQMGLVY